jgi:hypothetical protein
MSIVTKINDHFKEILGKGDPVNEMKNLAIEMAKYDMTMKGKPFPTFLKPYMVSKEAKPSFKHATIILCLPSKK